MVRVKPRIKKVFLKVVENGGNVSKAMRDSGYSAKTAHNPNKITRSKSWQQLVKDLPDEKLMRVLEEGLEANRQIGALVLIRSGKDGKLEQVLKDDEGMIEVPDHQSRHKFLETGLKIKKYLNDDNPIDAKVTVKIINYKTDKKKPNAKHNPTV